MITATGQKGEHANIFVFLFHNIMFDYWLLYLKLVTLDCIAPGFKIWPDMSILYNDIINEVKNIVLFIVLERLLGNLLWN